jgi:2-O-(6-phospho-alpha-D-mannosyl)-D-glycerate hydrolase
VAAERADGIAAPATVTGPRRFFVVPHTHWDREWYVPFEEFQLRLAQVVDEVIDVLESDPSFTCFTLDGQAIVLEDYLDARPENEGRLRALLQAGRLEVGPSYVLPDELLVGAEPLVRNLLIGRAVCERFGAAPAPVGYMPDSFGHPLQLPQILAGFGIDSFIFSRGLGDELDDLGVVFRWRAPDGSEVRAFQQLPSYSNFNVPGADAQTRVEQITERFGSALARAGVDAVLLCDGEDHRRIRRDLPALCAELERRLRGTSFTIARYSDYVAAVDPDSLPAHAGELLGSRLQNVLRGVNSARLYLKRANERAERRLLEVETLGALRTLHTREPFPVADFRLAWRRLLQCQPHDSICGCSCDEVHRDMLVRYEHLERMVSHLERRALEPFAADSTATAGVVNVLPYRRRAIVEIPGHEPEVIALDGFTARPVEPTPGRAVEQPREGTSIESDLIRVEAAPDGTLTILDKLTGRRFAGLHRLEDEPDMGDLYNFCPVAGAETWRLQSAETRVLRDGPIVSELELHTANITTVVRLIDGIRRVEFRTTIDNRAQDHRLRAVFPVGEASDVRAEGQFALVHRPLVPDPPRTDWVEPPDPTQHTLGAVALGPLALLTRGLPEYEARPGELVLTLLRCVGVISKPTGALETRPLGAGPSTPTPDGQCLGRHVLEYALAPGVDELDDAELVRAGQDYRCGFLVVPQPVDLDPPLSIDGDVVFSCLKGAEDGDGLILRCFNPHAAPASIEIGGDVTVSRTRLDESAMEGAPAVGGAGTVDLGPGEIATLRLRPRS